MAGAWTLLASNFGATSASTITVSATLTAGRALHVAVISDDATISSTADTLSNSYTEQGSVIEAAITRRLHNITGITATGGSTTITVTFAASVANRQIAVYEGTGVSSYDAHGEQTDTGSNPTGNVSATNSAQPASVHAVTIFYQGGTPTVGTGYTDSGVCFSGSGMPIGRGEYKSVSTTGAQTANFGNSSIDRQCSIMAIFLEPPLPVITVQPVQQTVAAGGTATFTTTVTGATSYQWEEQVLGVWTSVSTGSGGTTDDYTTATLSASDNGRQFRLAAINAAGTTYSAEVFLFISGLPITGKGRRGPGSAWWRRSIRKAGPISGRKAALLRDTPSRGPNQDNADFIAAWNDWYFPSAGGAPSHPTSGALAAQDATISGAAAHLVLHATTGALAAQAPTIAGSASHLTLHTTTGALSAQAATISGAAQHQHATTGALSAQVATVAGTATHATLHTTTGALTAQVAALSGAAQHQHATTGALSAQDGQISGAAAHATLHATSGALTSAAATLTGAAAHEHAATGALTSQAATVSGSSDHVVPGATHSTSGALAAQDAAVAGAATHLTLHTTSGDLAAQAAAVSGAAVHPHVGSGVLAAQNAGLGGTAAHEHAAIGALSAQPAALAGDAETIVPGGPHLTTGAMVAQLASLSGAAQHTSANGEDLTDAKFQGPSHNTRIRWQRKQQQEAENAKPEPAAAPAPQPKAAPRSTGLGEIAPPPVEPAPVPEIKVPDIRVVAPPKAAKPAVAPVEAPTPPAPVPPPPPAPPEVGTKDLARLEREMTAFVEGVVAGLTKQVATLDALLQAKGEELAAAQREIAALKRRETNRQRAEELARRIAEEE